MSPTTDHESVRHGDYGHCCGPGCEVNGWQIEDGAPGQEVWEEFLDHATRWGSCHEMAILDGRITRGTWLTPSKFQPCVEGTEAEDARERMNEARDQISQKGGA